VTVSAVTCPIRLPLQTLRWLLLLQSALSMTLNSLLPIRIQVVSLRRILVLDLAFFVKLDSGRRCQVAATIQ
jgi:hypothetical protein